MAKLGEVCLINPKSCTLRDDTEVSFIPMTKVGEHGEFDASEIKNYSEVKKGFTNFQNGDILFAKITPCMENGKGAIAHNMKNGIGFGSTEFHVLRPDTDKITSEWLYYLTTWKAFRKEAERNMTGSAGQKRVPKTFLENYVVNLPDIDTQKSENKILRKVDDLIFLRKQQLAKLDELVKARFVEMFGDSVANTKNFPSTTLETVMTVFPQNGLYKPQTDYVQDNTGIPILRIDAFYNGKVTNWNTLKRLICSETEINRYLLRENDIVINRVNSIEYLGKCAHIVGLKEETVFESNMMRFHMDEKKVNAVYVTEVLCTEDIYRQILRRAKKTVNQAGINQEDVKSLEILVPPLSLQNQFAAFVERVDQQKQTVQQSLEKLELMKKALMQEYFG